MQDYTRHHVGVSWSITAQRRGVALLIRISYLMYISLSVRRLPCYPALREEQGTTRTGAHPGGELHPRYARYGLH